MKGLRILIFLLIITAMTALPVMGTTIVIQQPEVVVKDAPLIVEVITEDIKFNSISNFKVGEAWITLKVVDRIVGNCPSEILIRRWNVTPELKFLDTEWDPSFTTGEHFIICLLPTKDGYSRMGLYNGKFNIENNFVKGTQIHIDEFKKQIKEVREDKTKNFPAGLPRQTKNKVINSLKKTGEINAITSEIAHLNGEFTTFNRTWNTQYLPVQMHYNPSGAPSNAPGAGTIASLANTAYSIWADANSFLTFQNASSFTTTTAGVVDDYSVIYWYDPGDVSYLAETKVCPEAKLDGDYYGPGTNTGSDIWLNSTSSWYFNQTPPSTRNSSQYDFVDILAHELGHAIGLVDLSNYHALMNSGYLDNEIPIRGQSDGDRAGNVYQHTSNNINLSGTISQSIVLSALNSPRRTVNITGNVSIPSGKAFELEYGKAQVNLNVTWIKSTGGSFIDEGDNIWNPDLKRTSGTTLLGHYSTLETAVSDASAGQSIDVLNGSYILNGNISIPTGVTLTINQFVTINLNGHSIVSTGGTINYNGATINGLRATLRYSGATKGLCATMLSAINAAGSGSSEQTRYYVNLQPGSFNEDVTVSGKNYLTIYGTNYTTLTGVFTFYGCNNLNLTMSNYRKINAYYCNNNSFYCDVNGSLSQAGFGLFYCTNFNQQGGYINNCNIGLTASGSSGWSQLANYSSNNTSILSSAGSNVQAASNMFCESVNYDFSVNSSGYIASFDCYFRNGQQRAYNGGGTINGPYTPHSCSMAKGSAETGQQEKFLPMKIQSDNPVEVEFSEVNASYFSLLKKIKEDKEKGIVNNEELKNEMFNIVKDFKNFIKKNPQSSLSRVALTTAANSFWIFNDNNNKKSFLDEIINDKDLLSLKGNAENLMIDYYSNAKDFDGAINAADAFIYKYKNNDELLCEGLLKKGIILLFEMNQPEKAAECFSIILQNYPDNPFAGFAKNGLELSGERIKEKPEQNVVTEKMGFNSEAYPNPFNPTTIISYTLPTDEKVVIKVYDIIGREVTELVNEFKAAGKYTIQFNGNNLSSGVYFYSITAGNYKLVKKIMLTK